MNVLLITGAIDINKSNPPFTELTNLDERLRQYIYSIEFAILHYKKITHIVFCENTGFDFDKKHLVDLALAHNKLLEFISYDGDFDLINKLGKGFGEGEIIKYSLNNSQYLKKCEYFYKLTGRLVVRNIDSVISTTKNNNAFIFYSHLVYFSENDHVSTVFYKVNKNFYISHLIDVYQNVDDYKCVYIENLFLDKLKKSDIKSFKVFPIILGQSGSTCLTYELNFKNKILGCTFNRLGVHNIKKNLFENLCYSFVVLSIKLYLKYRLKK